MSGAATAVMAAAAVAGTAIAYSQGQSQKKAARAANDQAQAQANKQAKAAEEATNRANQKTANIDGALGAAAASNGAGASGTMLTGPQGIDASALTLGKNTLLGN